MAVGPMEPVTIGPIGTSFWRDCPPQRHDDTDSAHSEEDEGLGDRMTLDSDTLALQMFMNLYMAWV